MSTKVAFSLRRRADARSALALYLPARDVATLLALCARLGLGPGGRVFDVAGGFVLKLDEPTRRATPGAVRLYALTEDLFIPVDADLVPALLDDEMSGLTRRRGLIFLPAGRVLAFDPRRPIDPAELLTTPERPRRTWATLPEAWQQSERIEEILIVRPEETPEQVLEAGGEDIGTEAPRPPESGAKGKLLGGAAFGAGMGMSWLGKTLGIDGLARLGSRWLGKAVEQSPRLSEALLGRQAAALRALLQDFRAGNLDRALRHALPLGEPGADRGAGAFAGEQLPPHGASFSLRDILETPNQRGSTMWMGEAAIMAELTQEYRKAAEEATRRGDHRRAAFIYGKLLRDYRAAANVLLRGGLLHEAAVVLLAKVDDRPGAARAFEAAGELDRALQLFREVHDHQAAGDLLRRMDEEDAARAEYRRAAELLAHGNGGHLAAGDMLLAKLGCVELAEEFFRQGWALRPHGSPISCALRLATLSAELGDVAALFALVDEADEFLEPAGRDPNAAVFYNELAKLASLPALNQVGEELRDRALLGLAVKLRQRVATRSRPANALSGMLDRSGQWPAALVYDAAFAVGVRIKALGPAPKSESAEPVLRLRISAGIVSAVCSASETGEVFVGFESGDVYCFRPESGEVLSVGRRDVRQPVAALAIEPTGRSVVILRDQGNGVVLLTHCRRQPDGSYRGLHDTIAEGVSAPWLTPILPTDGDNIVGIWEGEKLSILNLSTFAAIDSIEFDSTEAPVCAAFLLRPWVEASRICVYYCTELRWQLRHFPDGPRCNTGPVWRPHVPEGSGLRSPVVAILPVKNTSDDFVFVGVGRLGTLYWSIFLQDAGTPPLLTTKSPQTPTGGFLAAALLPTGDVAAVSRSSVTWLRSREGRTDTIDTTLVAVPSAVACFASHATRELIIVSGDGFIARVRYPSALAT